MGASSMIILIFAALAFSIFAILIAKLVTKTTSNKAKLEPYECGIPTTGQTWVQLNVGYYLFALIFLIFDVELVFLYPWAVVAKKVGWMALVEIVIFFFILFMGFLYAHKKGALKWM
ncbi:MAG: NADH-quinone oxidoreductase subunit A [Ferruginibacter sp.]